MGEHRVTDSIKAITGLKVDRMELGMELLGDTVGNSKRASMEFKQMYQLLTDLKGLTLDRSSVSNAE